MRRGACAPDGSVDANTPCFDPWHEAHFRVRPTAGPQAQRWHLLAVVEGDEEPRRVGSFRLAKPEGESSNDSEGGHG
jgi:hypothetical protein